MPEPKKKARRTTRGTAGSAFAIQHANPSFGRGTPYFVRLPDRVRVRDAGVVGVATVHIPKPPNSRPSCAPRLRQQHAAGAVFLLGEVFGDDYDEVAERVDKSRAYYRKITQRAREHVAPRQPRFFDAAPNELARLRSFSDVQFERGRR